MQFDRDRDPTMSESNRSPRLSNRSLQVASTLSTEDEILRSETLVEFAREVSDFGVSDARSLSQRPAKSRKCRGPSARLKTCRKQEVSLVEPDGIEPTTSSMPLLWPHLARAFLSFLFVENLLEKSVVAIYLDFWMLRRITFRCRYGADTARP
jgi:hypothetical protein